MMCSRQTAFSLVTLYGIAVFAILRKSYLRNAANKKDIISQLPDDILISIISFMPIKDGIRTSVLSKRWRNLYNFVSNIDFQCDYLIGRRCAPSPHDYDVIINGVERFLRLRSGSKIRSFHFYCCLTKSYTDRFEQCISCLGRLGVEELVLQLCCFLSSSDLSFSCHLLSEMPSLKSFRLVLCSLQPNLISQRSSLQILRLSYVTVLPGALECILSNCLSLHSLEISFCKFQFPNKLCFRGPNLQLKSLKIQTSEGVEEIELYASNLITFEFQNSEVVNFIFDHTPELQSMHLELCNKNIMSYVCGKLAEDLPHLKSLTFATKGDFYQESSRLMGIETFSNLRRLELRLYCTPKINLLSLTPFLQSCPLLQEFYLAIQFLEYNGPQLKMPLVLHS